MKKKHIVARYIDGDSVIEREFVEEFTNKKEALKEFESQKGECDGDIDDAIDAGYSRVVTLIWFNVDEDLYEDDLDWGKADVIHIHEL